MRTESYPLLTERDRRYAIESIMRQPLNDNVEVRVGQARRNKLQNAKLHAMLSDVADQVAWPPETGLIHDIEWWKRTLTLQWLIDEAEERQAWDERPTLVVSLDGETVAILLPHTSELTVGQYARLIEFIYSFGGKNLVIWTEKERDEPPSPEERI